MEKLCCQIDEPTTTVIPQHRPLKNHNHPAQCHIVRKCDIDHPAHTGHIPPQRLQRGGCTLAVDCKQKISVDIRFPLCYSVAEKQVAQMEYEKKQIENQTAINAANAEAEQKRIAAQAEADRQIIAAQAEADAILAVAQAQAEANRELANSVTENLIEYEKIEKWDGKLPTVSGANSIVSIEP